MSPQARTLPGYDLWLDDFKPGDAFETEGVTVTESMIIDFAMQCSVESQRKSARLFTSFRMTKVAQAAR